MSRCAYSSLSLSPVRSICGGGSQGYDRGLSALESATAAGEASVDASGAWRCPRPPGHLNGKRTRRRLPDSVAAGLGLGRWQWRR
jgi:hypothetical protein